MRHQIIGTLVTAASDQWSPLSPNSGVGDGVLFVIGPLSQETEEKPLPYVLIRGQETDFAILPFCSYHFYCGISKGLLLESCLALFSLFLSSGQLSQPMTPLVIKKM